ncbi:putative membrane protein [Candidatus Nanobsidianus stetteri]|uniref:Putative membrane protein n=1 Tax=Nanobsidianus stetteri TaxID=1294122 RepID=R1FU74_NANST|nr:putative membrane protein [Candidatus Nanobsidianus stetteri]
MDWKKVVLVSVFSVLVSFLSGIGMAVAISLLMYMLVKGMDKCIISNLGLALEFAGLLIYIMGTLLQPVYSNFQSIMQTGVYLLIGGLALFLVGMLVVMLVKNKVRENIYEV